MLLYYILLQWHQNLQGGGEDNSQEENKLGEFSGINILILQVLLSSGNFTSVAFYMILFFQGVPTQTGTTDCGLFLMHYII